MPSLSCATEGPDTCVAMAPTESWEWGCSCGPWRILVVSVFCKHWRPNQWAGSATTRPNSSATSTCHEQGQGREKEGHQTGLEQDKKAFNFVTGM